jgi:hypothetical protein
MPYHDGGQLPGLYAAARRGGYGFFASNVTQFDVLVGLLWGADRAGADLIVQTGRDSAAFYGGGDAGVGVRAFGAAIEQLAEAVDVGVFWNVDHVHLPDRSGVLDAVIEADAALDVFREEPLPADHDLLDCEGVVLSPHVAGSTRDAVLGGPRILAEDLARWLEGEPLVNTVD